MKIALMQCLPQTDQMGFDDIQVTQGLDLSPVDSHLVSTSSTRLTDRSVFSTQFANGAFERVSTQSILLVVFLSLSIYLIFTYGVSRKR